MRQMTDMGLDISVRDSIVVSPELTIAIGRGAFAEATLPDTAVAIVYGIDAPATLTLIGVDDIRAYLREDRAALRVILLVARAVTDRMDVAHDFGATTSYHQPTDLRTIALALCDRRMTGEVGTLYRAAKGCELLCETIGSIAAGSLAPFVQDAGLSHADSVRILAVRRLIDERWQEKLTLERIACMCGLNREKLTRGFREMFECTVGEAIAERRLNEASRMLLTTDLPVSAIGYENGYLNNASFARAFGRRFGVPPSDYRANRLAA